MKDRIFGSDRITINEKYTFKMSEIQGIYSEHHVSSWDSLEYMQLFVLMNGASILVDKTRIEGKIKNGQLEAYHKKWEEDLSNVGKDPEQIKKEKVTI